MHRGAADITTVFWQTRCPSGRTKAGGSSHLPNIPGQMVRCLPLNKLKDLKQLVAEWLPIKESM